MIATTKLLNLNRKKTINGLQLLWQDTLHKGETNVRLSAQFSQMNFIQKTIMITQFVACLSDQTGQCIMNVNTRTAVERESKVALKRHCWHCTTDGRLTDYCSKCSKEQQI